MCRVASVRLRSSLVIAFLSSTVIGVSLVSTAAQAQTATQAFLIPAQSLDGAMAAFSRTTRIQVLTQGAVTQGVQSSAVSGDMTPSQALRTMLTGTGLVPRFAAGNTVTLVDPRLDGTAASAQAGNAVQLDVIDVSGDDGTQRAKDAPYQQAGSSSHISQEDIGRIQPHSVGDMFKTTPGVISSGNRNGNTLELNIRGLQGNNRVATLIDGTQQTSSYYRGYTGNQSRTSVDPELIGGIDIEKGPSSGPYGAGSMGGVVNMRTLEVGDILKPGQQVGGRVRGSFGSNNADAPPAGTTRARQGGTDDDVVFGNRVSSIAAAASTKDFDLLVAAAERKQGNYYAGEKGKSTGIIRTSSTVRREGPLSLFGLGEEVFNTWQSTQSQLVKGTVRFAKDMSLELGYIHYKSEFGEYDDLALQFAAMFGRQQIPPTFRETDTYTAKYKWKSTDNDLIDLHANLWRADAHDDINYFFGSTASVRQDVHTTGGELWNTSRFDSAIGGFELRYGTQYTKESAVSTASTNPNGNRELTSTYAHAAWRPIDWLKFETGVRYETFEGGGTGTGVYNRRADHINPSAALTLEPIKGIQFFAKYAEGWRPPSVRELTAMTPNLIINPGLKPETAQNWEYGINVLRDNVLTKGDKARFKAVYFDNTYHDYIVRINRPGGTPAAPYWSGNINKALFKGFEFSGSYDTDWAFVQAAYTQYTDVRFCMPACVESTASADFGANYVPPDYSGSVTGGVRFFDQALTLGGRVDFVGRQTINSLISGTSVAAEWEPSKIYGLFASYELNKTFTFNASVDNLLDTYYLDAMTSTKLPAPGRTIRFGATAKF